LSASEDSQIIEMKLFIYSLDKTLYEGGADVVTLPTETGEISVLPAHAPLVTILAEGDVRLKSKNKEKTLTIKGGFAEINQKQMILLVK